MPQIQPQRQSPPDVFNTLPRIPPNVLQPQGDSLGLGSIPIIHRPKGMTYAPEIVVAEKQVPEIEVKKKENSELEPLKCTVRLPPSYQYEIRVIPVTDVIHGSDPAALAKESSTDPEEVKSPKMVRKHTGTGNSMFNDWSFSLFPNEVILDMKTVNLT